MIQAVILAASRDFGRCPIASLLPVSMWPVVGQLAIERVLKRLETEGIREVCICSEEEVGRFEAIKNNVDGMRLEFLEEPLRVGTAGCIREAAKKSKEDIIVVIPASVVYTPNIKDLVNAHIELKADLTAVFNPDRDNDFSGSPTGIYVCGRSILEHIPPDGYYDIKEGLIPELVRRGKVVKFHQLSRNVGNFRDGPGYLQAVSDYLQDAKSIDDEIRVWIDESADIDSSARLIGPVVIMAGVEVAKNAVIFGPAVIGRNCRIGKGSAILNSVLWNGASTGENCEVSNCLLDYKVNIADNTVVRDKVIAFERASLLKRAGVKVMKAAKDSAGGMKDFLQQGTNNNGRASAAYGSKGTPKIAWFAGIAVAAVFLWSYWPIILDLWNIWLRSDEYSSGLLVPFLAAYVLWSRREQLKDIPIKPSLWGLAVFLFAEALRLFGLFFMYCSAVRWSVVVAIAALALLLLGWQFFKKTALVMLFLLLMLPWPNRVQAALALPLQDWATSSAVFCLEVVGYEVVREGNIIHIGSATVAVAEACNGLRMITAFFVISGLVVLLVKRAWWEKLIVFVSSLPIALFCNSLRLAVTAVAFTTLKGEHWERIFHDFGGYAMMPLALGVVVAEFWFLTKLTTAPKENNRILIVKTAGLPSHLNRRERESINE